MVIGWEFQVFYIVTVCILGLVFGSFMNVLVYRVPRGKSIVSARSFCVRCGSNIKWYYNIPLFGYLALGGKCSDCSGRISLRYPLVELITGVMFLFVYLKFGFSLETLKYIIFVFLCLVCAFTDIDTAFDKDNFETGVIPMVYPFIGIAVGLGFAIFEGRFTEALAGSAAGFLILLFPAVIYSLIRKVEGMGEGDFYLFAMIGSFTGLESIPSILTISALAGVIIGVFVIAVTKNKRYAMPFAPMLCFGGILYVFFAKYLSLPVINIF